MNRPLVLLAAALAAGILAAGRLPARVGVPGALAFLFVLVLLRRQLSRRTRIVLAAGAVLFGVGLLRMEPFLRPLPWPRVADENRIGARVTLVGTVCRFPEPREGKVRLVLCDVETEGEIARPGFPARVLLTLPADGPSPGYGERLRLRALLRDPVGYRNPGGFDHARHLRFQGLHATAVPAGRARPEILARGLGSPVLRAVGRARDRIAGFLDARFAVPEKELAKALVIGEQGRIPEPIQEIYRATGLAHILAISGSNVAVVAALAYLLLWRLLTLFPRIVLATNVRKLAAALTFVPLVFYVLLAGMGVSTVRAGIMLGVLLLAILLDRERDPASAWSFAALLILLLDPPALFSASFQLSFAAVAAIFLVLWKIERLWRDGPVEETRRRRWARLGLGYVAVSLAANLATLPLTAHIFHRVSLVGFPANLLLVPLLGGLGIPLVLLGAGALAVSETLAAAFFYAAIALFRVCGVVLARMADWPGAWAYVPGPRWVEIAAFYALLVSLLFIRTRARARLAAAGAALVLAGSFFLVPWLQRPRGDLRVTFLDVGQGDSILIEARNGRGFSRTLVDGGGVQRGPFDLGRAVVAPLLWHRRIDRLDRVILTHPHPDHFGGLRFVVREFPVGEFWWNAIHTRDPRFADLLNLLRARGVPIQVAAAGRSVPLGAGALHVLFPPPELQDPENPLRRLSVNDQSLVLSLRYPSGAVLLSGDAGAAAEEWFLSHGPASLAARWLKVGHHAHADSATAAFLAAVRPEVAAVSVGRFNSYGAPSRETLGRLHLAGARILRTDRCGAITLDVREGEWSVRTEVPGCELAEGDEHAARAGAVELTEEDRLPGAQDEPAPFDEYLD